jgi:hypothetical protein
VRGKVERVAVEILRSVHKAGDPMLDALEKAIPDSVSTRVYQGNTEWLILYGVGAPEHNSARNRHIAKGGKVLIWDLGYTDRKNNFRMSINDDHPQRWLDKTPTDKDLGVTLRDVHDPNGPVILVGMGRKSRAYLNEHSWERRAFAKLRKRGKKIIFRPKGRDQVELQGVPTDRKKDFNDLLVGASLVYARHSNCCIDAIISNVPFMCEDGAAKWLKDLSERETFLSKLAYWQWKPSEAAQAWEFAQRVVK